MEKSIKLTMSYDPLTLEGPHDKGVFYYQDSLVPYLRLKVTAYNRTWVFDKAVRGKHLKRQIGNAMLIGVPEARRTANDWAYKLEQGEYLETRAEAAVHVERTLWTVEEVWNEYLKGHLCKKDSCYKIENVVKNHFKDIKPVRLSQLTPKRLKDWRDGVAETAGVATANKGMTILKAALTYCKDMRMVTYDETVFKVVRPLDEFERNVSMKKEDMPRLIKALENQSENVADAILLLIYTLQRKSNVLAMEWSEIHFETNTWRIPARKLSGERTKSGRDYHVALTPRAMEILQRRKQNNTQDSKFVFPTEKGASQGHLSNLNTAWLEIRAEAELGNLRLHDLRHTGATWLAQAGANAFVIQKALNHASVRTSQRYIDQLAIGTHGPLVDSQASL